MCYFTHMLDICLWYSSHKDSFTFLAKVPDAMFLSVKIMNEKIRSSRSQFQYQDDLLNTPREQETPPLVSSVNYQN